MPSARPPGTDPPVKRPSGQHPARRNPSQPVQPVRKTTSPPGGRQVQPPMPSSLKAPSQSSVVVARPAVVIGAPPVSVGTPSVAAEPPRRPSNPARESQQATSDNIFGQDLISEKSLDEVIMAYLSEDTSEE
jgi:hypothetical protein